ncbi:MAG: hypothetical protein ABIO79_07545 [Ferruginibacter sp.]
MIQILIFIAIIATGVLIYFKNKVENRSIDRSNRLAEKHEELIRMLQEKKRKENHDAELDNK